MSEELDDNLEQEEELGFLTDFEEITPWNGANDTGKDVRMKWLRNFEKIRKNFEMLSKLWSLKEDSEGNQYAYTNLPIVGAAGMTLFAGEPLSVDSIFKGLPLDTQTLQWTEDGRLTVVGGTGGGTGDLDEEKLWQLLGSTGTQQINPTHMSDALKGYLKEADLTEAVKNFVTLDTEQSITGMKTFVDGLKIGEHLIKIINGVLTLDCSLAVTGGITIYAIGEQTASTIMDGIICDETTITKSGGKLKVIGGVGGASNWDDLEGKPTTLAGYGISASDVLNTLKTVDGGGSGLDADTLGGKKTTSSGSIYGTIPVIGSDGVLEIGRYIDFHYENTDTSDYKVRLQITNSSGAYTISLPEKSGTIALTSSNVDSATNADKLDNVHLNEIFTYMASSVATNIHLTIGGVNKTIQDLYSRYSERLLYSRNIWGQPFDGTSNVTGSLSSVSSINFDSGGSFDGGGVELYHATPFIDFHYGKSSSDYTSRIIEPRSGLLSFNNRLFIENNGYVGVNNSSPSRMLDVTGSTSTTDLYINGIRLYKIADGAIMIDGNLAVTGGITCYATGTETFDSGFIELHRSIPYIEFYYNNAINYTSKIQESSSGLLNINSILYTKNGTNVGIGTSSPSTAYKLHVNGSTNTTDLYIDGVRLYRSSSGTITLSGSLNVTGTISGTGSGGGGDVSISSMTSTSSTNLSLTIGNSTKTISDLYATYTDYLRTSRTLWGQSFNGGSNVTGSLTGVTTINASGRITALELYLTNGFAVSTTNLVSSTYTVAVRPSSTNPFIGLYHNSRTWYIQGYNGRIYIGNTSSNSMSVDVNGNIYVPGTVSQGSDIRLKTGISTLENRGYITPKTFWKDGIRQIGFIAQDVQALYPELVLDDGSENHYLSLNYSQMVAVLEAQIIELKNKIEELENKLNAA